MFKLLRLRERQEQLRKYSNIGTDREALFLEFLVLLVSMNRTDNTKKKERSNKRERENERERKRERKNEKTRESFNQKHNHKKAPLFAERKKNTEKTCLSTHHGEPRSGGNLERVTREKRERGAFSIVVSVFFLFSFSLKEARAKSVKDSIPFRSDSLSEEGVCGSNPKHY